MNDTPVAKEFWLTFAGMIDQNAVSRLMNGMAIMTQQGATRVHLLFQSSGGYVGDGICLYHYWHSLPTPLTLYNTGNVASIATVAFLGAPQRCISKHATFMLHRSRAANQPTAAGTTTAFHLAGIAENLVMDDRRSEAILRERVPKLSKAQWQRIDQHDLLLTAQDAVKVGIATEIAEWKPPIGTQLFNL